MSGSSALATTVAVVVEHIVRHFSATMRTSDARSSWSRDKLRSTTTRGVVHTAVFAK